MAPCSNCGVTHPILRHHMTGHLEPDNCIKALAAKVQELEEKLKAVIAPPAVDLGDILSQLKDLQARVANLEADQVVDVVTDPPSTGEPLPEGVRGVTTEELHAAVEQHLDAGGTVVLEQPRDGAPQIEHPA